MSRAELLAHAQQIGCSDEHKMLVARLVEAGRIHTRAEVVAHTNYPIVALRRMAATRAGVKASAVCAKPLAQGRDVEHAEHGDGENDPTEAA